MDITPTDDCLVHQHKKQLHEFKHKLSDISKSLASLDLDEKDKLTMLQIYCLLLTAFLLLSAILYFMRMRIAKHMLRLTVQYS